ncbi:metal ABC transporter ATP-binding protein [bacterium]|nr:metal ABC transporter ATP-binding protein [bacterium]
MSTAVSARNSPTTGAALNLRGVNVRLGGAPILRNINADFPAGRTTAIIGPNGAGKTTLMRAILGFAPHEGRIEFNGRPLGPHPGQNGAPAIGYVPQHLDFDRMMPLTVLDFLCLTAQRRPLWFGHSAAALEMARSTLARMHLSHFERKPLGGLSGGELQRVMLALALQNNPPILILDEPISGVDVAGEEQFCELLAEIQREGRQTILLITHDLAMVNEHADFVLCLNREVLMQGPTREVLTHENIGRIFGLLTTEAHQAHTLPEEWFEKDPLAHQTHDHAHAHSHTHHHDHDHAHDHDAEAKTEAER